MPLFFLVRGSIFVVRNHGMLLHWWDFQMKTKLKYFLAKFFWSYRHFNDTKVRRYKRYGSIPGLDISLKDSSLPDSEFPPRWGGGPGGPRSPSPGAPSSSPMPKSGSSSMIFNHSDWVGPMKLLVKVPLLVQDTEKREEKETGYSDIKGQKQITFFTLLETWNWQQICSLKQ